jgi:indole-3-glycerol phosphate synthase
MSRLDRIIEDTRETLARRKRSVPESELLSRVNRNRGRPERAFIEALAAPGISLIAEHKRRSPSAGAIREDLQLADVVGAYVAGGASALSVLTEESHFGGSLDDLREARSLTELPIIRKDFVVDSYQLLEAADAGADAVLLIVAALDRSQLAELAGSARALGLDVLVEVHDESELEIAVESGAELIGINNRNLRTFEVDLQTTFDLLAEIPAGTVVVAESGISTHEQVASLDQVGVDAILVGEALMRSDDLAQAVQRLLDRT